MENLDNQKKEIQLKKLELLYTLAIPCQHLLC
uniref:Uncharacterized protein n=1 Tax=Podoviridae sp. ct53O25 TaxID=2826539 RepID=A0A8S5MBZ0_9CAUD|nr:MAG TPA: hypothetical protein [Podoviridae sp. ct53O25]